MVRSEGNMSLKNRVTPPGIDPGTVRLVAQLLNHYANKVEQTYKCNNVFLNPLKPNDPHMSRTTQLNSRHCISYIYSTNICTEYFKHAAHSLFFFLFKMHFIS
jgi:hypothetical protein